MQIRKTDQESTNGAGNQRISSKWIRDYYGWDYMSDVDWQLLYNNLHSAEYVLDNPSKFPRADIDALQERQCEISQFLQLHGTY